VETIPLDMSIELVEGTRHTWQVLLQFIREARETIDFTAMYWRLLHIKKKTNSSWAYDRGAEVYAALRSAAERGVKLRALCGAGLSDHKEIEDIQRDYPDQVSFQTYDALTWYGGGIMHMKFWIFDDTRGLITSANMDWKSLAQVKELGIAFEGPPNFLAVKDLQLYFDRWWAWTAQDVLHEIFSEVSCENNIEGVCPYRMHFDQYMDMERRVPCFSWDGKHTGAEGPICDNPMASVGQTAYNLANPMPLVLNGTKGSTVLTCSPPAVCDTPQPAYSHFAPAPPGRTWDGDALVQTILGAKTHVNLSVMNFIQADYDCAWWPALSDALLAKVARGVQVRLLLSKWKHTSKAIPDYLLSLQTSAQAVASKARRAHPSASLEIRYYEVPGWQGATGKNDDPYASFSRVNHGKYIVTDNRFNVGTSNMEWGYFYKTAGLSFNSDHPLLRAQLTATFERDWDSEYAKPWATHLSGDWLFTV
jgi:phospholipase D3/4